MKKSFSNAVRVLRMWALGWTICCIASTGAIACAFPDYSRRSILFEHVPTDISAPVIIEVTIYDNELNVSDAKGRMYARMNARVDRVIAGSIHAKTLRILDGLDCYGRGGDIGQGIVLGQLRDDPQLGLMLEAVSGKQPWSSEFEQKQGDLRRAAKCVTTDLGTRRCTVSLPDEAQSGR